VAKTTGPYILFLAVLFALFTVGQYAEVIISGAHHAFEETPAVPGVIIALIAFMAMSALSEYFSRGMIFQSFVLAIFLGFAGSGLLGPLVNSPDALVTVVNVSAAVILLQGGLEIKFSNFLKLIAIVLSLSFIGLFVTAIAFTFTLLGLAQLLGVEIMPHVALLLGAILASTDPAALVPLFKKMKWLDKSAHDAIIAESAGSDVTGAILTFAFLAIVTERIVVGFDGFNVWNDGYAKILTLESAGKIAMEMLVGTVAGIIGWLALLGLSLFKKQSNTEHAVDPLMVKVVGVAAFYLAYCFHGSGFLAVFVAGLLFNVEKHMKVTEHRVGDSIDAFFKPAVFVTLGAIIDLNLLLQYAPIGITAAIAFMAINRPIGVLVSLLPLKVFNWTAVTYKDIGFIASVRETGAIPAVLLLTVKAMGIPGADMLVAIGTWVILLTLVIGPLYKNALGRKLGIAA
jgi:potassium/hydrogen antiporter